MKCNDIIDTALLIMGHSPRRCPPTTATDAMPPTLRQRLSAFIEPCAASLAAQAFLTTPGLTRSFPMTSPLADLDGNHYLPLPEDFLRLDAIRLSDWTVTLRETTPISDPRIRLQYAQCNGIKARPTNPLCVIATPSTGDDCPPLSLLLFGSRLPFPTIITATYCVRPKVRITADSDEEIDWPEELLFPLARKVAQEAAGELH